MSFEKKVGVVLAGGESRRFGEPKAFSQYNGKAMYQWAIEAIRPLVDETIIVSHPTLVHRFEENLKETVYEDEKEHQGTGPLAGIYTVMKKSPATWYYIIPCDTPLVTTNVFKLLEKYLKQSNVKGITPIFNGKLQPLISIFHRDLLPIIDDLLSKGFLRMTDFVDRASIVKKEMNEHFPDNPFVNINTKLELQTFKDIQPKSYG